MSNCAYTDIYILYVHCAILLVRMFFELSLDLLITWFNVQFIDRRLVGRNVCIHQSLLGLGHSPKMGLRFGTEFRDFLL